MRDTERPVHHLLSSRRGRRWHTQVHGPVQSRSRDWLGSSPVPVAGRRMDGRDRTAESARLPVVAATGAWCSTGYIAHIYVQLSVWTPPPSSRRSPPACLADRIDRWVVPCQPSCGDAGCEAEGWGGRGGLIEVSADCAWLGPPGGRPPPPHSGKNANRPRRGRCYCATALLPPATQTDTLCAAFWGVGGRGAGAGEQASRHVGQRPSTVPPATPAAGHPVGGLR